MATQEEVQRFLNDFLVKIRVFQIFFVNDGRKNTQALLDLELSTMMRRTIIESLKVEDFSQGPLDDKLHGVASMWVFGKIIHGVEIYIKISMGRSNSPVLCISFHQAEHNISYPYKTQNI